MISGILSKMQESRDSATSDPSKTTNGVSQNSKHSQEDKSDLGGQISWNEGKICWTGLFQWQVIESQLKLHEGINRKTSINFYHRQEARWKASGLGSNHLLKRDHWESAFPSLGFAFFCVGFALSKALCSCDPQELQTYVLSLSRWAALNVSFPITLAKVSGFSLICSGLGRVPTPAVGTTPEPSRLRGQRSNQEKVE